MTFTVYVVNKLRYSVDFKLWCHTVSISYFDVVSLLVWNIAESGVRSLTQDKVRTNVREFQKARFFILEAFEPLSNEGYSINELTGYTASMMLYHIERIPIENRNDMLVTVPQHHSILKKNHEKAQKIFTSDVLMTSGNQLCVVFNADDFHTVKFFCYISLRHFLQGRSLWQKIFLQKKFFEAMELDLIKGIIL